MPSPNIIRFDSEDSYYHVYSRGVAKSDIFKDNIDKTKFVDLLARYLAEKPVENTSGGFYDTYHDKIDLCSFALMDNHFHLLIYQKEQGSVTEFMRRLLGAYVRYFNLRHSRVGYLFQSRYCARIIVNESDWLNISRYIHRNPFSYRSYEYSSYLDFIKESKRYSFVNTSNVLSAFGTTAEYEVFVDEYQPDS